MMANGKRIGLALSGGGARGIAHVGILKVLEREHVPVDVLSGTSMGGLVAGLYALGWTAARIEQTALKFSQVSEMIRLVDINPLRRGLLEGNRVRAYLQDLVGEESTFEDLARPLALSSVDLISGKKVLITQGNLLAALMATIAVPGVFPPVRLNGQALIDGGVLDNLPLAGARELGADCVIAVDVLHDPFSHMPWQETPNRSHLPAWLPDAVLDFYWSNLLMVAELTRSALRDFPPEVIIRPELPAEINMFMGFQHAARAIEAGEKAAEEILPVIRQVLELHPA